MRNSLLIISCFLVCDMAQASWSVEDDSPDNPISASNGYQLGGHARSNPWRNPNFMPGRQVVADSVPEDECKVPYDDSQTQLLVEALNSGFETVESHQAFLLDSEMALNIINADNEANQQSIDADAVLAAQLAKEFEEQENQARANAVASQHEESYKRRKAQGFYQLQGKDLDFFTQALYLFITKTANAREANAYDVDSFGVRAPVNFASNQFEDEYVPQLARFAAIHYSSGTELNADDATIKQALAEVSTDDNLIRSDQMTVFAITQLSDRLLSVLASSNDQPIGATGYTTRYLANLLIHVIKVSPEMCMNSFVESIESGSLAEMNEREMNIKLTSAIASAFLIKAQQDNIDILPQIFD